MAFSVSPRSSPRKKNSKENEILFSVSPRKSPRKKADSKENEIFFPVSPRLSPMKNDSKDNEIFFSVSPKLSPRKKDTKDNEILCRNAQINQLKDIFGEPNQVTFPCIFIYGHPSTGKTYTIQTTLKTLGVTYSYVNCVESFEISQMYNTILNGLMGHTPNKSNGYTNYTTCDNMNTFVRSLKEIISNKQLDNETVYLVLDEAEKLRHLDPKILTAFVKLQELTHQNICVILISQIIWSKFSCGAFEPLVIHFPQYTMDEIAEILNSKSNRPPHVFPPGFYEDYIQIILMVFYNVTRDLIELRQQVFIHFDKYMEPVKDGTVKFEDESLGAETLGAETREAKTLETETLEAETMETETLEAETLETEALEAETLEAETLKAEALKALKAEALERIRNSRKRKLWKNISPVLAQAMKTVYLKQVSASNWKKYLTESEQKRSLKDQSSMMSDYSELPYNSKFLLMAAYLASYNPSKTDKRFFVKQSDRRKKGRTFKKNDERTSSQLLGPKPFPLERLLAIFDSIIGENPPSGIAVLSQVSTLVTLKYLQQTSSDSNLEQPRYKCLATLAEVQNIGKSVNFEIVRYLYDFCLKGI